MILLVCVFMVLVNVRIFCLLCLVSGSEHNICCFMKVHNLPIPIVSIFIKSFRCALYSSLGLSTNTFLKILNEESNKVSIGVIFIIRCTRCKMYPLRF